MNTTDVQKVNDQLKLKTLFSNIQSDINISKKKIDVHESQIMKIETEIKELIDKRDDTSKLKKSHVDFASSFNNTLSTVTEQIKIQDLEHEEKLKVYKIYVEDQLKDIRASFCKVNERLDHILKMLDF